MATHLYLCKLAHHEVGVFKSVVLVVIIAGWGGTFSTKCTPAGAPAVVFGVKRIHNDGLGTLNFTATERTASPLTLRLLYQHNQNNKNSLVLHVCCICRRERFNRENTYQRFLWLLSQSSQPTPKIPSSTHHHVVPARLWGRRCTSDDRRARSSHLCHFQHRSYTAGK